MITEKNETAFRRTVERSRKAKRTPLFDRYPEWIFDDIHWHAERLRNAQTVMDIPTKLSGRFGLPRSEIQQILAEKNFKKVAQKG
jgi:hypothetical protein